MLKNADSDEQQQNGCENEADFERHGLRSESTLQAGQAERAGGRRRPNAQHIVNTIRFARA